MVTVFFEMDNGYAEIVAKFDNEETYMACLPALELLAGQNGFDRVTETVNEEEF